MRASMFVFNKKHVIYLPSLVREVLNLNKNDTATVSIEEDCIKIQKTDQKRENTVKVVLCAKYDEKRQYYALMLPEELAKKIEEKFGKKFDVTIKFDGCTLCALYTPLK